MTIWAIVKSQHEGFHCWPDAPEIVSYLRNLHRHLFYFEVWIEQTHDDREVEYHSFLKQVRWIIDKVFSNMSESCSCEMIAELMIEQVKVRYVNRRLKVFVMEDNENGACVE